MTELEPVAWLIEWHESGEDVRQRVQMDKAMEPWLRANEPVISPLVTLSSAQSAIAEARDKALDEAAKHHDVQAEQIAQIAKQNTHNKDLWDKLAKDVFNHQRHAAAIRALKEKP